MKKLALIAFAYLFSLFDVFTQGISINSNNTPPDESAIFDVQAINKGMLIPRLTNTQRDAISSPAPGLFIFNTDEGLFQYNNGTLWKSIIMEDCTPSQPGPITGDEYPDCNETGVVYSIDPVPGATYYKWILSSGMVGAGGQGTTSILVNFGTTGGIVRVRAESGCGNSTYSILPVTVGIPPMPDTIYGNPTPGCNETGVVYSIDPVGGADNYTWSVPATATLVSGQGTDSITVDFTTTGGDISVRTENNCGFSDYKTKSIYLGIPLQPGTITGSTQIDCYETNKGYYISPVAGATSYAWTVPADASVVSGQGSTSIMVDFGSSSGNISVSAVNSCGGSAFRDLAVTIGPPPTPGLITGDPEVCANAKNILYTINAVSKADMYIWTVPPGALYTQYSYLNKRGIWVDFGTQEGEITVRAINNCGMSAESGVSISMISPVTIGCAYKGGIIFYMDEYDTLVCSEADIDQEFAWGCYGIDIPDAELYGVLDSDTNTFNIVNACADYEIAARICDDLVLNGYDDWVLPSRDALTLMYTELHLAGIGDFLEGVHASPVYYWSSTQVSLEMADAFTFYSGNYEAMSKYKLFNIRAVRRINGWD